ncbi:MAG TPA: TldD/PmbA family protein [Firmicutes bacterium]|nr:TldD/PmbA family protein [Bacillota bacterium]
MELQGSVFLQNSKPTVRELIKQLSAYYSYVSVLGTDTSGHQYVVSRTGVEVSDSMLCERGFCVRVHNGTNYSEFSFNDLSEDRLEAVVQQIVTSVSKECEQVDSNTYPVMVEEELDKTYYATVEIDPSTVSAETVIEDLSAVKNFGMSYSDLVVNVRAIYDYSTVSKIYMSTSKDLEQSYVISNAHVISMVQKDGVMKYYHESSSGLKGYEVVSDLLTLCQNCIDKSIQLLDAKPVLPGEYEIICTPEISGLIAHEAFGHGVEMDMFVKNRAKGAEYLGHEVASLKTSMHDGAAAAQHVSSYLFDDEGTLGSDTLVIENGILNTGISDLLSALKLGTQPTGNGKRQSFERKAYARMTNTFFASGQDTLDDMIASVKHGYLLEGMMSGMEDPKNWGIQCIMTMGHEIKDGKLTGHLVSPVIMTGFVPDLLKSISMVSETVELDGAGFCGKGYKELVKTANGGPYIKAKARLG